MNFHGRLIGWMVILTALGSIASLARADAPASPTTNPSASVNPDAQELLTQIGRAYTGLKSLSVAGKMTSNFDIDGQQDSQQADFTAIYNADGKFRHELKGDAVLGNTGEKVYAFIVADNAYIIHDAAGAATLDSLDPHIARVVRKQNPSLALALSGDAQKELLDGALTVQKIDDVKVDAGSWPALRIITKDRDLTVAVDAQTHLLRWTSVDVAKALKQQGAHDVKSATLTYDYASTSAAPVDAAQFAWSPPPGAQEMQAQDASGVPDLEGKPAPAFALSGLDGKQVSSDDLKGSVYVLDFWATWCGPCVAALPHLDDIYKSLKDSGLKVYAVDQGEDKDTVQKFVTGTKLSIPVLLDSDAKVGDAYGAQQIPETVVVGKDGKIRKVFLAGSDDEIRDAIKKAMAQS